MKTIYFRPTVQMLVLVVFGIAMVFLRNVFGYVVGAFFIIVGGLALAVTNYKVAEIYDRNIIVYDKEGNVSDEIPHVSIKEWNINSSYENALYILTRNNREYKIESFNMASASETLKKLIKEKETSYIKSNDRSWRTGNIGNLFDNEKKKEENH